MTRGAEPWALPRQGRSMCEKQASGEPEDARYRSKNYPGLTDTHAAALFTGWEEEQTDLFTFENSEKSHSRLTIARARPGALPCFQGRGERESKKETT